MSEEEGGEETVRITLRLPKAVHDALVTRATGDRRSLNAEIVYLLEQLLLRRSEPTG